MPVVIYLGVIGVLIGLLVGAVACALHWRSGSKSARLFEQTAKFSPIALAIFDEADKLTFCTLRYSQIHADRGVTVGQGTDFRRLLEDQVAKGLFEDAAGREADFVEERMQAHRLRRLRAQVAASDGHWLEVEEPHRRGGSVVVLVDVEDFALQAEALALARDDAESANRAKSEFLANMSHEIRTPLNGVIGVAEVLAAGRLDARQKEMVEIIRSSGVTLDRLLSDILDLARMESRRLEIRREPFLLGDTLRAACRLVEMKAQAKGLEFEVRIDAASEARVEGDAERVKQIVLNLLSNAIKFTERGQVGLEVRRCADEGRAPVYEFQVTDTGIGFSAADHERLFGRFEQADVSITRRFGGTGLGLAIAGHLAALMGGRIEAQSTPGKGSTFRVRLPLPTQSQAAEPATGAAARLQVLLAEDHPVNRRVIELMLDMAGADLVSVENGQEALERFHAQPFDLILMDLQMPVMDGLTAIARIRAEEAQNGRVRTPILVLTANAMPEHVQASLAAGADAHVSKPVTPKGLFDAIDRVTTGRKSLTAGPSALSA